MIAFVRALGLAAMSAALLPVASQAATIIEINVDGAGTGSGQGTSVQGLNDNGDVVGTYVDTGNKSHAFIRHADGTFQFFDFPDNNFGAAINAGGQITGNYRNGSVYSGFITDAQGAVTPFDVPNMTATGPEAIDVGGDVVGGANDSTGMEHGFFRSARGKITVFDAPGVGSGKATVAQCLNRYKLSAGFYIDSSNVWHGFVRDANGTITSVDPAGSIKTNLRGINDGGTVVGSWRDSTSKTHGLVRAPDGTLSTIDVKNAAHTNLAAINKRGTIAGVIVDTSGIEHSIVRNAKGHVTTFDPADAVQQSGFGSYALAVNNNGAVIGNYLDLNGASHGYIRTP